MLIAFVVKTHYKLSGQGARDPSPAIRAFGTALVGNNRDSIGQNPSYWMTATDTVRSSFRTNSAKKRPGRRRDGFLNHAGMCRNVALFNRAESPFRYGGFHASACRSCSCSGLLRVDSMETDSTGLRWLASTILAIVFLKPAGTWVLVPAPGREVKVRRALGRKVGRAVDPHVGSSGLPFAQGPVARPASRRRAPPAGPRCAPSALRPTALGARRTRRVQRLVAPNGCS